MKITRMRKREVKKAMLEIVGDRDPKTVSNGEMLSEMLARGLVTQYGKTFTDHTISKYRHIFGLGIYETGKTKRRKVTIAPEVKTSDAKALIDLAIESNLSKEKKRSWS